MKKFYNFYLLVALIFLASCEKESTAPGTEIKNPKMESLTSNQWVIDDAVVHLKYTSSLGTEMSLDTTFSMFAGLPACNKDLLFDFNTNKNFEMKAGTTYCGEAIPKDSYKWEEKDNFDQLLIVGKNAGGLVYNTKEGTAMTISDTLKLELKELNTSNFTGVYNVPMAVLYASMGVTEENVELMKSFGVEFSGKMEITYKWKKK